MQMAVKDIYYADYKNNNFLSMKPTKLSSIIYANIPLISGNFDRLRKRRNFFYQVIKLTLLSKMNSST